MLKGAYVIVPPNRGNSLGQNSRLANQFFNYLYLSGNVSPWLPDSELSWYAELGILIEAPGRERFCHSIILIRNTIATFLLREFGQSTPIELLVDGAISFLRASQADMTNYVAAQTYFQTAYW